MPKKLELSVAELRYMREQGMTNHDIANAVGCSSATVSRYLSGYGKAPRRYERHDDLPETPKAEEVDAFASIRGMLSEDGSPKTETVTEPVVEVKEPVKEPDYCGLEVLRNVLTVKGALCQYEIDLITGDVLIKDGTVEGVLDRNGIYEMARELMRIHTLVTKEATE